MKEKLPIYTKILVIILIYIGHVVYLIAEKLPVSLNFRLNLLLKYTLSCKLHDPHQLDFTIKYLKDLGEKNIVDKEFEENVGVL